MLTVSTLKVIVNKSFLGKFLHHFYEEKKIKILIIFFLFL